MKKKNILIIMLSRSITLKCRYNDTCSSFVTIVVLELSCWPEAIIGHYSSSVIHEHVISFHI